MDPGYYSHKFRHAALRYEVGLSLGPIPVIVWVRGGVPAGRWSDLRLARDGASAVINYLRPGEKILADKGYRDATYFMFPFFNPANEAERRFNYAHKRYMARHETVNAMFKSFAVARQMFRHSEKYHQDCIFAIANVINAKLRNNPSSFPNALD